MSARFAAALASLPALGLAVSLAGPASATEWGNFPDITGTAPLGIEFDFVYDQPGTSSAFLGTVDFEPDVTIDFLPGPPNLVLYAHAVITGVADPVPGEDNWFNDTGMFLQDLYVQYGNGRYELTLGKFSLDFGTAWNLAPDVYGQDFASDYEYDEQVGVSAAATFGTGRWGFHTLTGSAYFMDDSIFSKSAFTNRGRNETSDGGPGNTGKPNSFLVAYDMTGLMFPTLERGVINTQVAFNYRAEGDSVMDTASEKSFALSVNTPFPIWGSTNDIIRSEYLELIPVVEYVRQWDAGGMAGVDMQYLTAAATLVYGGWQIGAGYTWRETDPVGASSFDDHLVNAQVAYQFINQIQLELGWSWRREMGVESQMIGLVVNYEYDW